MALPDALCPNVVGVNPVSGFAFVGHHQSDNVSILSETQHVTTAPTGEWPTDIDANTGSNITYITHHHGSTIAFQGSATQASLPAKLEPFAVAYNSFNNYVYVTDPHLSEVRIFQNNSIVTDVIINDGSLLDVAVHPHTGLTYVTGWEHGNIYVLDGAGIVTSFSAGGWGPRRIAIDPTSGYVYVANSEVYVAPTDQLRNNVTVIDGTQVVATYATSNDSYDVAVDPVSGYAYFANHLDNTITILRGKELVGTVPAGEIPWAVDVHARSGFAFVTNRDSNSVTVLRGGQIVTTLPTGEQPFDVAVNPVTDYVYIANRTSQIVCDDLDRCEEVCAASPTVTILR
jgi:DNA-binding beta-propeller fold protein YncE